MDNIKLSEGPFKWVQEYLKERVKAELDSDCEVEPALDPQFDLYVSPGLCSEYDCGRSFHVIIVPILPEEDFGSANCQVAEVICEIDPVDKEEDYLIYEYDVQTGGGSSYFFNSEETLCRLLNSG